MDIQPPQPTPQQDSPPQPAITKRRRTWLGFFRDVFLYVLVYVAISGITIGPFFWQWFGAVYVDGPKWIARAYVPLLILCHLIPPLGWLINAWVDWWIL